MDAEICAELLARPNDPGPRLVYADWLEERGDLRAEVVRLLNDVLRFECENRRGKEERLRALAADRIVWPGPIYTNSVGMELVWIPAGEFVMGGDLTPERLEQITGVESKNFRREHPQRQVRLTHPFYIGRAVVTQGERSLLSKQSHRSYFSSSGFGHDFVREVDTSRLPLESISWNQAVRLCRRLTKLDREAKILPKSWEYRLPTEAQWEYACRAGTMTAFSFGATLPPSVANTGNPMGPTTVPETYPSNPFGLFDMHGNVLEWCQDWFRSPYLPTSPVDDPVGVQGGKTKVLRGGCYSDADWWARSAARHHAAPDERTSAGGLRVCLSPTDAPQAP